MMVERKFSPPPLRLTRCERYDEVDGVGRMVGWSSDENFRGWWLVKRGASNWQTGTTEPTGQTKNHCWPVLLYLLFCGIVYY